MRCIPYNINSQFAFKEAQLARAHRIILKWSSILAFPQFLLTLSAEVENINIVTDLWRSLCIRSFYPFWRITSRQIKHLMFIINR